MLFADSEAGLLEHSELAVLVRDGVVWKPDEQVGAAQLVALQSLHGFARRQLVAIVDEGTELLTQQPHALNVSILVE